MLFKRRDSGSVTDSDRLSVIDPREAITDTYGETIDAVAEEAIVMTTKAVIGQSIRIKGDVTGDEDLLVEGVVEGTVSLPKSRLTIGESGNVSATVNAKSLSVEGSIDGDVNAGETVVLSSSAKMQGNIKAPRITIEDGCRFKGMIDMDMEPAAAVVTDIKPAKQAADTPAADKHAV